MTARLLLVEDDEKLGLQVEAQLRAQGYAVQWVRRGDVAMALPARDYALIILDLMLPGRDGLEVLAHFRGQSDVPVLVLSAKQDTAVKVRALQLGADDYLGKPFWPEELLARVGARLRRPVLQHGDTITLGALQIDTAARRVRVEGAPVELTRAEFDLLLALARRPGDAITRAWLTEHVLDPDREGTERTLDVHISRLRKKLGPAGARLATIWGIGYRLLGEPTP